LAAQRPASALLQANYGKALKQAGTKAENGV
jgi:hypothetical protein